MKKGVRQGDTCFSLLIVFLEEVFKILQRDDIWINGDGEYLNNQSFAGNIILLSELEDNIRRMIKDLSLVIKQVW